MTSTRDSMRRELRELAKLADTMRKEQDPELRSSGEWSAVELPSFQSLQASPSAESDHAPGISAVRAASPVRAPFDGPHSPMPPVVESFSPMVGPLDVSQAEGPTRRRSPLFVGMAALAAAFVLVVSGTVGRSLMKAPSAAAQTGPTGQIGDPSAPGLSPTSAAPPGSPSPQAAPPEGQATAMAPALDSPGPAAVPSPSSAPTPAAPASNRHRLGAAGAAARPAARASTAAKSESTGGPSAAKPGGASPAGGESLDDLIRKAVQNPTK